MFPVLFKIGNFELHTYGVMLAAAFAVGFFVAVKIGKQRNLDFDQIYGLTIVIILSSIIGSRLAYVIFHLEEFEGRWLDTISPIQSTGQIGISGMVVLGGVVTSIIVSLIYLKKKNIPAADAADTIAPALALGLAIGRVGCFFNGCCFGKICHLPWGMSFPEGSMPYYIYGDIPLHPTQLYAVIYNLLIFAVLMRTMRIPRLRGMQFPIFLVLYGVFRGINESLRYYGGHEEGMRLFGSVTFSQLVSILFVLSGLIILIFNYYRNKKHA